MKKLFPIDPLADKLLVITIVLDKVIRNCQQDRILTSRPGRQPGIAHAGGIAEPRIERNQFRTVGLCFDDALCMRIEIVARLQMA